MSMPASSSSWCLNRYCSNPDTRTRSHTVSVEVPVTQAQKHSSSSEQRAQQHHTPEPPRSRPEFDPYYGYKCTFLSFPHRLFRLRSKLPGCDTRRCPDEVLTCKFCTAISLLCEQFVNVLFDCPTTPSLVGAKKSPAPRLAEFVAYALYRTRLPSWITYHALYLLQRLKAHFPAARGTAGHPLFLSALMIASKVAMDETYSNKCWTIVGQGLFELEELNHMERELFGFLNFDVQVDTEDLVTFKRTLHHPQLNMETYIYHACVAPAPPAPTPHASLASSPYDAPSVDELTPTATGTSVPMARSHTVPTNPVQSTATTVQLARSATIDASYPSMHTTHVRAPHTRPPSLAIPPASSSTWASHVSAQAPLYTYASARNSTHTSSASTHTSISGQARSSPSLVGMPGLSYSSSSTSDTDGGTARSAHSARTASPVLLTPAAYSNGVRLPPTHRKHYHEPELASPLDDLTGNKWI